MNQKKIEHMRSVSRSTSTVERSRTKTGNRKPRKVDDGTLKSEKGIEEKAVNPWKEFKGLFKGSAAFERVQKRIALARKRRIKLSK